MVGGNKGGERQGDGASVTTDHVTGQPRLHGLLLWHDWQA